VGSFELSKLRNTSTNEVSGMADTTTAPTSTTIVGLTEAAAAEVKRLLVDEEGKTGLRMEIKGGGCSGMSYGMSFDNAQEKDHVIEEHGVKLFIDPKSAIYLKGTVLDFQSGLDGQGFVIKNPQAKGSCGCGNSFSV
jgi:iron-sulfur cluster assembly accessory protein